MTTLLATKENSKNYKLSRLLERFLSLVEIESQSDPHSFTAPSTPSQKNVQAKISSILREMGVKDVRTTEKGLVYASIPAHQSARDALPIGFCAHMDTSYETSGGPVNWQIFNYTGGDIKLNAEKQITFDSKRFPEIEKYVGEDIVFTDGTTLLGADDKAGVAAILEAANYFIENPEIPHAEIRMCFTPDEEVGRGTENLSSNEFGAKYAYTVDGGERGSLDTETFNAAHATIVISGLNTHPGSAKGKMINAIRVSQYFLSLFPENETPENTERYQGFFHPVEIEGTVSRVKIEMIIRDHDKHVFAERKNRVAALVEITRKRFGCDISLLITDQYPNVKQYLDEYPKVAQLARQAIRNVGLKVIEEPVRGGTDGCHISAMGIPCANIFAGGLNFHGKFEYIPVKSLEKSYETIVELCKLSAHVDRLD